MPWRLPHNNHQGRSLRRGLLRGAGLLTLLLPLLLTLGAAFRWADRSYPFPVQALHPPAGTLVLDRHGEPLRIFLPLDGRRRFPVRLDEVSPELVETLVASEDRYFRLHPGVNPLAVLRAAVGNLRAGRVVSGGSTITMQLARLCQPAPRTWGAKLREAFRALQLERRYSKDEILEHYLNLAPFGGNIVGIGAAAWFYCGKLPAQLSLGEAALLSIIPRAPRGYDPFVYPERALRERDKLLDKLQARGLATPAEVAAAKAHPLPRSMRRLPFQAPHLAQELFAAHGRPGGTRTMVLQSTLDLGVQRVAQALVDARIGTLREQGLGNVAVVVLEHNSNELRALVGTADFFDTAHQGQINAALIKRSPGSALKPFLYALALEQGLVAPESLLLDLPKDFAGYVARNYDNRYSGQVTVTEALARSLNAPAVDLLNRVGVAEFLQLLRRAGLRTLDKPAGHYGLPLVLGAGEVRLLDLVNAYAALARGGEFLPVRDLLELRQGLGTGQGPPQESARARGVRLLSPEACRLTAEMLAQVERSDLPQAWSLTRGAPAVAWKTGTSFGHRDAWAVGFSGTYAIGVWVGNLDGRPEPGISGARHAGPLLLELFRALEPEGSRLPSLEPLNLDEVEVCAASRELATPLCTERLRITVIPGRTRLPRDTMHRRIFVDAETGERLMGDCLLQRPHTGRVVRLDPPELTAWRRSRGQGAGGLPHLSPLCSEVPGGEGPKIVSPSPRTPYLLRPDAPLEFQRIALAAQAGVDAGRLYWYQDGELLAGGAPEDKLFLTPRPGEHTLVLMDSLGRQDAVTYSVRERPQGGSGRGTE